MPGCDVLQVLVIDAGADAAEWVCQVLSSQGYAGVRVAPARALGLVTATPPPAAVIVDLVPGTDDLGFQLIARLRAASTVPILALSALGHADERVRMRRIGVAAILTKPFPGSELLMRLRALTDPAPPQMLCCGDLTMDPASGRVERAGRRLDLTPRERALLEMLLRHRGEVVTRTVLLETVWNYRFDPHASLVDTHVSRLRRKIDDGFPRPLLHTRRRVGYKLSENP